MLLAQPSFAFDAQQSKARGLAYYTMGVLYDLHGKPDLAVEEFKKAVLIDPNASVHLRLGADYARLGKLDEAIESLNKVLDFDSQNIQARYLLALIYSSQREFDKAAVEYESILTTFREADPQNIEIYGYLGQLYYSQKKYRKALEQFEIVLSLAPENSDIMFLIGSLHLELNEMDEAVAVFKKAVLIDPQHDGCLNSLGYLYAEAGTNLEEAQELVERALKIDPDNGAYLDSLGWIYYRRGEYDKALETFEEADSHLKDPVIYEHMGDVYYKLNRSEEAERFWSLSLDLLPGQERVLQKLKDLE